MNLMFTSDKISFILAFSFVSCLLITDSFAQARGRPLVPTTRQAAPSREKVTIRRISGIGASGRAYTPEYNTDAKEHNTVRRTWARISVEYTTKADWINELEFRYYTLVQHPQTKNFYFFPGTVTYIDIAKGEHASTIFLSPSALKRYGAIKRIAVEIYSRGQLVAVESNPKDKQAWWRMVTALPNVKTKEGMLLNRAQTPFAFVAFNNYEMIKHK